MAHIPVLLNEVINDLLIRKGGVLVDGTLGGGGHSRALALHAEGPITIVGLDRDASAIKTAAENLKDLDAKIILKKSDYRNFESVLIDYGIKKVDAFLLDLGFSSNQMDGNDDGQGRGFSFQRAEPLLMTLDDSPKDGDLTAQYIVNNWDEKNIETIIRNYGEEKHSKKIAKAIVEARKMGNIDNSLLLSEIITRAVGRRGKIHPATKSFQALRITVNDELGALLETLPKMLEFLKPDGRISVISFHSLDDRIVKTFGKNNKTDLKILHKKPVIASAEEITSNPRSRSAKLRTFQKISS